MMRLPPPANPRIEVILFSGDSILLGPFEMLRALLHRYMLVHYILLGFFLTLVDTRTGIPRTAVNDRAVIVLLSVIGGLLLLLAVTVVVDLIALQRRRVLRIAASPVLAAVALCGVVIGEVGEYLHDGYRTPLAQAAVIYVFYYVLVETVAHFVVLVVIPRILRDLRSGEALPAPAPAVMQPVTPEVPDLVEIGGQRIPTRELVRISAEGNYLRVQTLRERFFLPGPFGRVVDLLPERLGVRVSRSDWVALGEIHGLRRQGGNTFLDLKDGASVKVANTRQKMVLSLVDVAGAGPQGADGTVTSSQTG